MVTRAQALAALRRASWATVNVAGVEWKVRGLMGAERKALVDRARANDPMQAADLVALAVIDEDGEPLFVGMSAADIAAQCDGLALEALGEAILKASGLLQKGEASPEEARAGE